MSELLDIIVSAVDEASSIFESISGAAQDMNNQLTSINGSEMDDVASSADQAEGEIRETDEAVQELDNDLSIINSSMILQLGEQVGALGDQAEGMAQDMNEAAISVGQLATQTGIAEPEMVSLINTISNATFPNDEAMMYVKSLDQIGVSADKLGDSATNLDKINDAFDLGAEKTNSLGQELSVLGVDMNNVSTAFNALAYANANTVGGMDNYYNFLRKYDAEFKELGLNVDQASVIIAAATQKFGGGRAALSGLSSILKNCNGDLSEMEKELGLASGSLSNATALTGEYEGQLQELANEEMEHKTLLDQLGAAWEDISLTIGSVAAPLMSVIGLIGSVGSFGLQVSGLQTLSGLIPKVTASIRSFSVAQAVSNAIEGEGAVARVASAIGLTTEAAAAEGATVAFGGLAIAEGAALWPILAIAAAIAALIAIVYEVGVAFGWWSDVGSMLEAISAGVTRLWEAFINHPDVQAALEAISGALQVLWEYIQQAGQAIMEFFGVSTSGEFDVVAALIQGIGNAWNFVKGALAPVIATVGLIIEAFNQFRTGQMDLPSFIMTVLTTLANLYVQISQQIISTVIAWGVQLVAKGIAAASKFVSGIINRISRLPGQVGAKIRAVISHIKSGMQAWISAAVSKAQSLVSQTVSQLSSLPGKISSALSGVVSAITSPFQSAYDTLCGIVDNIKSKVNDALSAAASAVGLSAGGDISLPAGGDYVPAAGGDIINYTNYDNSPIEVDHNLNITLDLEKVPSNINTKELISALTSKEVLRELTSNRDFQLLDGKAKERLNLKVNRTRGI